MRKTENALVRKDRIIRAAALAVLTALTAVLIRFAADGKLFGSEADEVYDTFYAFEASE